MRSIAAIRTHRWTVEEERLLATLQGAFGPDVTVVYQNPPAGLILPVPHVPLDRAFVAVSGLREVDDWGWRCGDYAYYALRQARPDYDVYWLIEPDVVFTGDANGFFGPFRGVSADALGYRAGAFPSDVRFVRSLSHLDIHRAIFAMTRLSGRLIDHLFAARKLYSQSRVRARDFANDEVFVFTHAHAEPGISVGRLEDHAPGWFDDVQFDTDPDLLDEVVLSTAPTDRVYHPVRSRAALVSALSKRLCSRTQFLWRMAPAIGRMTDQEIEGVAADVARRLRAELMTVRKAAVEGGTEATLADEGAR